MEIDLRLSSFSRLERRLTHKGFQDRRIGYDPYIDDQKAKKRCSLSPSSGAMRRIGTATATIMEWLNRQAEVAFCRKRGGAMSKFLRRIVLSNWKLAFTAMTLALLLLIVAADLIVRNNGIQALGIEQDRVYQVREGNRLSKVIRIEEMVNINSPEFPKGFHTS